MTNLRSIVYLGATALLFGCTAGVKATPTGGGGSGGSGPGTGGSNSGGGSTGTGGGAPHFDADFDVVNDGGPVDGICGGDEVAAEPVPLDLYVLMDSSKSMNDATTAGPSKWDALRTALNTFFATAPAGLGVALKYFPQEQAVPDKCANDGECLAYSPCEFRLACVGNNVSSIVDTGSTLCPTANTVCPVAGQTCQRIQNCGANPPCVASGTATCGAGCAAYDGYCQKRDICTAANYAMPDVPVAALPGAAAALMTSLAGHSPSGFTPTGPALAGALMFARQRIASMPTHRVAVVLVTDGLPGGFLPGFPRTECNPTSIPAAGADPGIAPLLSGGTGAGGTPPVNTFVIGVFSPNPPQAYAMAQSNLGLLATAGGTAPAVIIDTSQDVSAALQNALKQVQSKAIACQYNLPTSGVSFDKVNVTFTTGSGTTTALGHANADGDGSGCDARGGWYYDKAPAPGVFPTKITACPATCSMFQTDLDGKVKIQLGCPTRPVE